MANGSIVLNPGSGGASTATWVDNTNLNHQKVVIETQTGTGDPVPIGTSNPLPVSFSGNQPVVGSVAAGTPDSGAGVKVSGVYNTSPPAYSAGQRSDLQTDGSGNLLVNIAAGQNAGGTSSQFSQSFPTSGTAIGVLNNAGTQMTSLKADASGNLQVNVAAGSVQAITDNNSAFTSGSTQALPQAYAFNDSASAVTSGNMGIPRITGNRQQRMVIDATANGGCTAFNLIAPATVAASVLKGSAGNIYMINAVNTSGSIAYLKVYNATAITLGTTAATIQFPIPASTTGAGVTFSITQGMAFSVGITIAVTGAIGLTDNTAVTASAINVAIGYA